MHLLDAEGAPARTMLRNLFISDTPESTIHLLATTTGRLARRTMHALPRKMLSELLSQYGLDLCEDHRRLEALLRDVLDNEYRREIFLFVVAAREGIPRELRSQQPRLPAELFTRQLVQQLCDNLALQEASARWAVESWAIALDLPNLLSLVDMHGSIPDHAPPEMETPANGGTKRQRLTPKLLSVAEQSVKDFEKAVAMISSGCSSRTFLMTCAESDFAKWKLQADAGVPEAQWLMGDCRLEGIGQNQDHKAARQWFQAANDSGLAWGTITLGTLVLHGIGGEQDIATGVNLLRAAVAAGEPAANVRLAHHYAQREGIAGQAKARQLLRDAVTTTYPPAKFALAMYLIEDDPKKSSESREVLGLMESAANEGHIKAKVYLAKRLLENSSHQLTPTDSAEVLRLLNEAATAGNPAAITILERQNVKKYRTCYLTSFGTAMVLIPAGRFMMGSLASEMTRDKQYHDESPPHSVLISNDFFLSKTVVTQSLYRQVTKKNPSKHKWSIFDKGQRPVERVTWKNAIEFCNAFSILEGLPCYYSIGQDQVKIVGGNGYRLPTEAEWEYACRADNSSYWSWGADEGVAGQFGAMALDQITASTQITGIFPCNDFGLCDMHGGVWEWCWDFYSEQFYSDSPTIDPVGPPGGTRRVARGGSYWEPPVNCRSATRTGFDPGKSAQDLGFRIARFV